MFQENREDNNLEPLKQCLANFISSIITHLPQHSAITELRDIPENTTQKMFRRSSTATTQSTPLLSPSQYPFSLTSDDFTEHKTQEIFKKPPNSSTQSTQSRPPKEDDSSSSCCVIS